MFLLGVETPQPFISIAPDPTKNVLITKYQNSRDFKIFFIPLSISTTATIFCLNFYLCTHNKSSAPIGRELKQLVGRRHFNRNKRVNSFVSNRWIDQFLSFFPKFLLYTSSGLSLFRLPSISNKISLKCSLKCFELIYFLYLKQNFRPLYEFEIDRDSTVLQTNQFIPHCKVLHGHVFAKYFPSHI